MREIKLVPAELFGKQFVPHEFLPPGEDEYYLRNRQVGKPPDYWRSLRAEEIETLVKNAVTCANWDNLLVADPFHPHLIKNSSFYGLVRIGRLENVVLEHHELQTPAGITNSTIISCDLGDNVAVHNVRYLSRYIIGDQVILLNIDEMNTTNHAKFGNGIVKQGEPEAVRIWLDLMNESGGRSVLPFDGMICADAYLWAKYRDDPLLQQRLREITERQFDTSRGFYGTVGDCCVIKNSQILKDVRIGSHCYIKGANKLKNLTINSSQAEPTQIGEGVELVNGIIGYGCHVFYGCKAVRFVMGPNSTLKYGARLVHSFLGDNSTVSCCEILNNLIFPAHEQHHNNSFLVASVVMGQSNMAAGATIGSNHNSRANDGELQAGRGFWPGLCVTLKHPSRFASFVLVAKGNYPAELDIPLPFSLVANDEARDRLLVIPAYWWTHNMYALARNTWKFINRDKRKTKTQNIEFDYLAPDTAEEIFRAMHMLEVWTGKAALRKTANPVTAAQPASSTSAEQLHTAAAQCGPCAEGPSEEQLAELGRRLLCGPEEQLGDVEVLGEHIENSRRKVVIRKPHRAYHAYRQMLYYYGAKNVIDYMLANPQQTLEGMNRQLAGPRQHNWVNLGGQLVAEPDLLELMADIRAARLNTWEQVHARYDLLWARYPLEKQRHAYATLLELLGAQRLTPQLWQQVLAEALAIQQHVCQQVYLSRAKDFQNPFRGITYRNAQEMQAVLGTPEDNSFVRQIRKQTEQFAQQIEHLQSRC